jgi:hypothetical protein
MTLVELMVTLAILGLVMAGTTQTLVGFQTMYAASTLQRQAGTNARTGLGFLERDLRNAGLAVDPGLAFDFTVYRGFAPDADPTDGVIVAPAHSFECSGTGSPGSGCLGTRDRVDGPDELVFYGRNPRYWGADLGGEPEGKAWLVTAAIPGALTLSGHGDDYIAKGQTLQVVCSAGANVTYVRASATVDNLGGGPMALNVIPAPSVPGDPYSQRDSLGTGCLNGGARAFAVDRFRYHIRELQLTPGFVVPFLALDTGLDENGDGMIDYADIIPVAAGIVDMQVAFVRPNNAPTAFARVGVTPGAALFAAPCTVGGAGNWTIEQETVANCPGSLRLLNFSVVNMSAFKSFSYVAAGGAYPSVLAPANPRRGADAANITEVEVHLVGRSVTQAHEYEMVSPPLFLNRNVASPPARYVYSSVELTVPVFNMTSGSLPFM